MKNSKMLMGWEEVELSEVSENLESESGPKECFDETERGILSIRGEHLSNNGKFYFEKIKYVLEVFHNSIKDGESRKFFIPSENKSIEMVEIEE